MTKSQRFEGARPAPWRGRWLTVAAMSAGMLLGAATARAQSGNPNPGALKFTGGIDIGSVYVFRGLIQEVDPKITLFPYGDIAIALTSGDGTIKSTVVNVGVWHSLNTGSSGTDGPSGHAHYEEQFYTRLNFLFGGGVSVGAGYMARTSPNNMFDTEKEIQLKVAKAGRLNPYMFLASELTEEGQADFGASKGTYLELGAVPTFAISKRAQLAVPVSAGFSVNNYYELAGTDHKFGFFEVGAMLTLPLTAVPTRFGFWNVHGGGQLYVLGDTAKVTNRGDTSKPAGFVGVGVTY